MDTCPLCGAEDSGTSCGAHPCGLIDSDAKPLADANALDEAYAGTMPAEQYNADLLALVATARALVAHCEVNHIAIRSPSKNHLNDLTDALEQFEPWLDVEETPQQMGWVDSQGRP